MPGEVIDADSGQEHRIAAHRLPEGLSCLGSGAGAATQFVEVVVEDLDGVAGQPAGAGGKGGDGVGPRLEVDVVGTYGQDVDVAVGRGLAPGEGSVDHQGQRSWLHFAGQQPQAVHHDTTEVGETIEEFPRRVVTCQRHHRGTTDLPPIDQPKVVQLGDETRSAGAADARHGREGRYRELRIDSGQGSKQSPGGARDHGLEGPVEIHTFIISNIDGSFTDLCWKWRKAVRPVGRLRLAPRRRRLGRRRRGLAAARRVRGGSGQLDRSRQVPPDHQDAIGGRPERPMRHTGTVRLRASVAAVGTVLAWLVAGCGSANTHGALNSSTTVQAAAFSPATTIAPAGSDSPLRTGHPAVTGCEVGELKLSLSSAGRLAHHAGVVLAISVVGNVTCDLSGYPTIKGLLPNGQTVSATESARGYLGGQAGPIGEPVPLVVLFPGQPASALIEGTDTSPSGGTCATFEAFEVTVPGAATATRLAGRLADCSGLNVHPIVGGLTGGFGD